MYRLELADAMKHQLKKRFIQFCRKFYKLLFIHYAYTLINHTMYNNELKYYESRLFRMSGKTSTCNVKSGHKTKNWMFQLLKIWALEQHVRKVL